LILPMCCWPKVFFYKRAVLGRESRVVVDGRDKHEGANTPIARRISKAAKSLDAMSYRLDGRVMEADIYGSQARAVVGGKRNTVRRRPIPRPGLLQGTG